MKRPLLLPLTPLYSLALSANRRFFQQEPRRLVHPVISIGSLSAGGAGKTPVVTALIELLTRNGYTVDVLSRGYGRSSTAVTRVNPAGTANEFGDEPLEIARRTGAAVFVGPDRYEAGLLAERESSETRGMLVHLLDDGFQHQKLGRDLDVVLLTWDDVNDSLLPAGDLREPLTRLRLADVVVLREEEADGLRPFVTKKAGAQKPIWSIRRTLEVPASPGVARPLAFCGIARPASFSALLSASTVFPVDTVAFPDHHPYTYRDVTRLVEIARQRGADGFITTEKDAVKLVEVMRKRLTAVGPLVVARLTVQIQEEAAVLAQIVTATANRVDRMRR